MRRDASRQGFNRFLEALRPPTRPDRTLSQIQRETTKWVWVWCAASGCRHHAPMTLAPLIIRWGPDASIDRLTRSARCSRCGHRGATLQHPSWVNSEVGFQPFPAAYPSPSLRGA